MQRNSVDSTLHLAFCLRIRRNSVALGIHFPTSLLSSQKVSRDRRHYPKGSPFKKDHIALAPSIRVRGESTPNKANEVAFTRHHLQNIHPMHEEARRNEVRNTNRLLYICPSRTQP